MRTKYEYVADREIRSPQTSPKSPDNNRRFPVSPLHWWHTRKPQSFDRHDVKAIRVALFRVDIANEFDWLRAITGHPATAIRVAIRQLNQCGMTSPTIDATVSAVLCCAIEGDHAARVLISSALRRRQKIDPLCQELILLWRAARF